MYVSVSVNERRSLEEITVWSKSTLIVNCCVRQTIAVRLAEDGRTVLIVGLRAYRFRRLSFLQHLLQTVII